MGKFVVYDKATKIIQRVVSCKVGQNPHKSASEDFDPVAGDARPGWVWDKTNNVAINPTSEKKRLSKESKPLKKGSPTPGYLDAMPKYALIKNGTVQNVVVWDGVAPFNPSVDVPPKDLTGMPEVGIGWGYDAVNDEFIAPSNG